MKTFIDRLLTRHKIRRLYKAIAIIDAVDPTAAWCGNAQCPSHLCEARWKLFDAIRELDGEPRDEDETPEQTRARAHEIAKRVFPELAR